MGRCTTRARYARPSLRRSSALQLLGILRDGAVSKQQCGEKQALRASSSDKTAPNEGMVSCHKAEAAGRNFVDPLIREICAQTLRVRACAQGHVCCSKAACTLGGVAGELARLSREAHIGCEHQSRVGVWF
jgi:hypothetical protein